MKRFKKKEGLLASPLSNFETFKLSNCFFFGFDDAFDEIF